MTTDTNKLIMAKQDYHFLCNYMRTNKTPGHVHNSASLLSNIQNAEVLEDEAFPWEIVRLHSKVIIRDKIARLNYTYTIVLPDEADHQKCKVSIFSPIGSALFGYKRGDDIYWQTQKGKRYFTIMAISQNNR